MAANGLRRILQRSLPALLLILLALVAAAPHADSSVSPTDVQDADSTAASVVADRTEALSTQFTAGVRGSRAPPVAAA